MRHTISAACGHTYERSIFGPRKDREGLAAWYAGRDCPECRREAFVEARRAEGADAVAEAAAAGLPALVGTERQIPYAASVRKKRLESLRKLAEQAAAKCPDSLRDLFGALALDPADRFAWRLTDDAAEDCPAASEFLGKLSFALFRLEPLGDRGTKIARPGRAVAAMLGETSCRRWLDEKDAAIVAVVAGYDPKGDA